ncbi:hypothetical protein EYZ11_005527 [Aspergillus tanneri]|uniref:Uncharacterized protein n=1 Tax=Aspergillus tanneri TaxID=1220188 RepID=A0A4V3UPG6_9EURO|nr:hypothetical protein EYZ11_005527 [Aspergillus tanneri]
MAKQRGEFGEYQALTYIDDENALRELLDRVR